MLNAPKSILRQIKEYDKELFIKWNNEVHYFEVWRRMHWGDKLITPVVSNIYTPGYGGELVFCPLDQRIVAWLYSADSQRKDLSKNWKWIKDKRFAEINLVNKRKSKRLYRDIAAEQYACIHDELLGLCPEMSESKDSDWLKPDSAGASKSRVHKRSAKNAKEYFNDNN